MAIGTWECVFVTQNKSISFWKEKWTGATALKVFGWIDEINYYELAWVDLRQERTWEQILGNVSI